MSRQLEHLWVISYDIQDNGARRQVHNLLKDRGQRVQYSVFECWMKPPAMRELRRQLQEIIQQEDSIRWYPLCDRCRGSVEKQGQGNPAVDPDYYLP